MTLKLPPPLPIETVLGAIDGAAQRTAAAARDHTVSAVKRALPAHSGRSRAAARGRVTRTPTGHAVSVAPSKTVRYPNGVTAVEVARFFSGGTGEHGPRKRPYPPRRARAFRLPQGWSSDVIEGQRPNPVYERVQTSEQARVARMMEAGAAQAARDAEAVLARTL